MRRTAWNVSSRVRTRRTGRPARRAMKATSGSSFACCLPPKPPPGSGAKTRTFDSGRPQDLRQDLLQPVRVLDRAPDGDPVPVRRGHERVGLDGEVGHHRERLGVLDDEIGRRGHGIHVAPAEVVLAEDVRAGQGVARAERRVLDERRGRVERRRDREDGRAAPRTRPATRAAAPSAASFVSAATAATGSPWYFVSPTARTGRSSNWGPKRGIGWGRSAAVMTRRTPGTARAALVSIEMIRARAQSSVTSFAWSTSGRWMSATYCWPPVTRSRPPTRAGEPPIACAAHRRRRRASAAARTASVICW